MKQPLKSDVRSFWDESPCGAKFTDLDIGTPSFYDGVERFRYRLEPHIQEIVDFGELRGKRIVEVGCGLGTDGAQFARAGGEYYGLDLSGRSVLLAKRNCECRNLSGRFLVGDAESLPFPDDAVDFVYSHGVIHHTPDIGRAVREIHRILRPGGRATVMVYHRNSWNYYVELSLLRRIGSVLLFSDGGVRLAQRLTGESLQRLRTLSKHLRSGGWRYLFGPEWLNDNTDGAGNPLSRVFSQKDIVRLFSAFRSVRTEVRFLHAEKLPVVGKRIPKSWDEALGKRIGWHLYALAEK